MNTELQNKVWSILPKEFRKEVKKMYKSTQLIGLQPFEDVERADRYAEAMCAIFGEDNLTSDADEEEMLTYEKSKAMQFYFHLLDLVESERMSEHYSEWCDLEREYIALFGENVFADYFGSKCLSDETCNVASKESNPAEEDDVFNYPEPKCLYFKDGKCAHPAAAHLENGKLVKGADCDVSSCEDVEYEPKLAEPKFKIGDKVRVKFNAKELHSNPNPSKKIYYWQTARDKYLGKVFKITDIWKSGTITLNTAEIMFWEPFDLEPYTELKENQNPSDSTELKPQDVDKHFDNILKDRFRDYNRLHIAAMAMQGILSNADRMKVYERIATEPPCEELAVVVARNALRYADTLMAKAKKGE